MFHGQFNRRYLKPESNRCGRSYDQTYSHGLSIFLLMKCWAGADPKALAGTQPHGTPLPGDCCAPHIF